MKQPTVLSLALIAVLSAGVAVAAAPMTRGMHHPKLDTNGDGVIDRSEAAARPRLAARFDQLDANHDGRIDASERPQHGMHGDGHRGIERLDANHDGVIDRSEAAAVPRLAQHFDKLDTNHDGRLDPSERPHHEGKGGHGGMLARLDTDHDGRLSRAEVGSSPMAGRFDQVDTNHDGFIDRDEGRQAMQRWRAEHGKNGPGMDNGVGSGGTGHH